MTRASLRRSVIGFTAFLGVATIARMALGRAQPSDRPGSEPSPQSATQAANSSKQKASRLGVWRSFGESRDAPAVKRGESGSWHRFGESRETKPLLQKSPTSQRLGSYSVRELEQQMYALINRERADPANAAETRGVALPLKWNEQLAAVARGHSQDMLASAYFAHQDPEGRSPAMRVEVAGLAWQSVAENIAIFPNVTAAEAAFMNETRFRENHRGTTLNPKFTEVGVGIVQGADGRYYITQDFLASPTADQASSE